MRRSAYGLDNNCDDSGVSFLRLPQAEHSRRKRDFLEMDRRCGDLGRLYLDRTTRRDLNNDPATDLNHTWFRKNENRAGRWTSPDPYNGSASVGNPQSWNRYSYVESQPTNFVDPSGLRLVAYRCWCVDGTVPGWTDPNPNCQTCYAWVNDSDPSIPTIPGPDPVGGGDNAGSGPSENDDLEEWAKCNAEAWGEFAGQVGAMISEYLSSVGAQYNKTVVAGMAVAVFGALGGNPFTAFSGAIAMATGIDPTKHPRAVARFFRSGHRAISAYAKATGNCDKKHL